MSQPTAKGCLPPAIEGPEPQRTGRVTRSAHRAFRLVIAGSSVSMLGTKISTLAFPMLVLWLDRSPGIAGLSVFLTVLPGVLLNLPAGIIVDKMNPWRVMICSEILRGITAISVAAALLIYGRSVNIMLLIAAMFTEEVLEMFTTLAERRYLNWMMDPDETRERRSQQASIEARAHVAVLAGRPLAPFLFTLSPLGPFLTDAASFVFSVTGLLLGEGKLKQQGPGTSADRGKSSVSKRRGFPTNAPGIIDALRSVRHDRTIWLGGTLLSMTSVVSQALILIFLWEANSHKFSTTAIGIVLAASGLGGAAGSYCSNSLPDAIRRHWIPVQMGAWLVTCAVLALTGGHAAWAGGCAMFIFSVTGSIGNVEFSTHLNTKVKDNILGKISGIFYAISTGSSAVGPVLGGYSVQQFGVHGSVMILLGVVGLMAFCSLFVPAKSGMPPVPFNKQMGRPAAERPAAALPPATSAGEPAELPGKAFGQDRSGIILTLTDASRQPLEFT